MRLSDLRLSVEQIQMDEKQKLRMVRELSDQYGNTRNKGADLKRRRGKKHNPHYIMKVAAAVFAVGIGLGVLSIPVRALVESLVAERMEELPQEEVVSIVEQLDSQETEADGFSREYTEGEKQRRGELYEAYLKGTFPEGELLQVDTEEEAGQQEFCYLTTNSTFYLPADRELTDEEILQMIDFEEKRNYALKERYEEMYAEEIAAQKAEEKEQIAQTVSEGGIPENEAVSIAAEYLQQMFGLDGIRDMELNHYYEENGTGSLSGETPDYCVNFSDRGSRQYYYFWIAADSGDLLEFHYSDGSFEEREKTKPSVSEASATASGIKEQAADFLKNRIGVTESYDNVETSYRVYNGEELGSFVYVVFHRTEQTVSVVTCHWDGTVKEYHNTTAADRWEEHIEQESEYIAEGLSEERGEKVTVELVRQ